MSDARFLTFPPGRLQYLLGRADLTLTDFATLMGVTPTQARQWVRGKSRPFRTSLPDFLRVFGLDSEVQLMNKEFEKKFSQAGLQAIGGGSEDLGSLLVRNDGLAKSRMVLWDALRAAYTKHTRETGERRWPSLQDLVENAPPPPGLPLPPDENLVDYPSRFGLTLTGPAALLYRFGNAVYPAFVAGASLGDFSVMKTGFDEFHLARMDMAKLWNRIGRLVVDRTIEFRQVLATVPTAGPLVNLLTYLEISLAQWCRNRGPGKECLFHLNSQWKAHEVSN